MAERLMSFVLRKFMFDEDITLGVDHLDVCVSHCRARHLAQCCQLSLQLHFIDMTIVAGEPTAL
jgi:hypothetical protein